MRSRRHQKPVLSSRAALALAKEVEPKPETRSESNDGIWNRFVAFMNQEGFDDDQFDIATRSDLSDIRDRVRRFLGFAAAGLVAAALMAILPARGVDSPQQHHRLESVDIHVAPEGCSIASVVETMPVPLP